MTKGRPGGAAREQSGPRLTWDEAMEGGLGGAGRLALLLHTQDTVGGVAGVDTHLRREQVDSTDLCRLLYANTWMDKLMDFYILCEVIVNLLKGT